MTVTVSLEDFWRDRENDKGFNEEFKDYIVGEVKREIYYSIKADIKEAVAIATGDIVTKSVQKVVEEFVEKNSESFTVKFNNYDKPVPISEWMSQALEKGITMGNGVSLSDFIKKQAESAARGVRERYDVAFATLVVKNMAEAGYLKDGISDLILKGAR